MNPETISDRIGLRTTLNKMLKNTSSNLITSYLHRINPHAAGKSAINTKFHLRLTHVRKSETDTRSGKRKVALITGATSGIGKEFAIEFARQQYDLIITGRRKERIDRVADNLRNTYCVSVRVIIADLMDRADIQRLLEIVEHENDLEVLVNNAGYGLGRIFHNDNLNHQLDMVKVHIDAPVMLIHKALPLMISKKSGTIINVSSLAAFIPTSTNIMYTSTKSFMLNFTESLNLAVKQYGVHFQCLCPGFTHTDFHTKIGLPTNSKRKSLFSWMEPSEVVSYSMRHLRNGKVLCIPGFMNRMIVFLMPFAPRSFYYYIARKLQQESDFIDSVPLVSKAEHTTVS